MMKVTNLFLSSLLVLLVRACSDSHNHDHDHSKRAYPPTRLTPPSRPLDWSDINFIHTTDSHGWLLGHQKTSFPEPNYSGDLGDFSSFVSHMKEIALKKDVDLLLIDSGDLHDGTGLSDGFLPGGIDAHESNKFLQRLPYDIMAIGNHELYQYNNTLDMYKNFAPALKGRYLSSNVYITVSDSNNKSATVPVGSLYHKFTTRKGRKVTSLGVMFNFTGNDKNTIVQPVEAMVNEAWFKEAIQEEPDFFLLVGHMPVREDNWPLVFNAIRAVHANTPILIFGGHTHIRDCVQFDGRSMALESGRYMETVGWMSAKLDDGKSNKDVSFTRRYLDPNRVTYEYHTKTSNATFDTVTGKQITQGLLDLAAKFKLDFRYGNAPHDYTLSRSPYPSKDSLLTLYATEVLPVSLKVNNTRASIPSLIVTNSYSQRFDLYAGTFTRNDQFTISPYVDGFNYIPNVPYGVAKQVTPKLNNAGGSSKRFSDAEVEDTELYSMGYVGKRYTQWLENMHRSAQETKRAEDVDLTLGYVTQDNCTGVGDDTPHKPIPYYGSPKYIVSDPPVNITDTTLVDLIYVDFIQPRIIKALNTVQKTKNYTNADVAGLYSKLLTTEVFGVYAETVWN